MRKYTRIKIEEWRDIPGYEGHYQASNTGKIRSLARRVTSINGVTRGFPMRVLRQGKNPRTKYLQVKLSKNGKVKMFRVQALVAAAFIGENPKGLHVLHYNDDPEDNRPENLRYGTRSENQLDAVRNGRNQNSIKVNCNRGHPLRSPNLVPSELKRNHRKCLSCDRARARVSAHPYLLPHLQEISDSYFAAMEFRAGEDVVGGAGLSVFCVGVAPTAHVL